MPRIISVVRVYRMDYGYRKQHVAYCRLVPRSDTFLKITRVK